MNDTQIVCALRSLLCAENKPAETTPLDLLQVTRLLVQHADERDVYLSQDTIAMQLCSSVNSVIRSQDRLSNLGWVIVRRGGHKGRPNKYEVEIEKLPIADLAKNVYSQEALHLATTWGNRFRTEHKKKFMRGWQQQWAFTIQKFIDRTEGGQERVCELLNFAFSTPKYSKRLARGPAQMRRVWQQLQTEFKASAVTQ
jgi:hypothetical protein